MGTQGAGRKRTTNKDKTTAEDDALNLIAREAEARLAAKRAARAEAREIRMKELEQQQKELSDDDERMSVGSRGSVRGSSLHRKSKKKKKHKHRDRNGCHDDHIALSSRSSFTSCDLLDLSGPSRNPGLSFNRYQNLLYDDGLSLCSGSRRVSSCHPVEFSSYRSSRASSRASSARTSPVVEDRDFDKGPRAASVVTATTLTSVGGTSSRRGSAETPLTVDADGSVRDIKEIHELKDQIQDVEAKYQQNLKEAKEALAEVEEKYRKAMVSNAQLDNEKNNLMYQVDTLKDSLMELEELLSESRRQYDDKLKEFERQKHANGVLQFQFDELKETLKQSEELLNEIRQLRLKQEGFIREISDLQETVEWKDKKIRALERQKDYSDAIRLERDELREEAVRLRDVLKKHGIVLGPDLNVNGDAGPAEAAGAERPAQAAPAEGNGVLGSTEELRACRDQDETLEDVKLNHWSCDGQTPEAPTSEDPDGQIPADPIDRPDPKAKAVIAVGQDLQQIQTSGDTETCEVDSPSHPGLTATDAPGGDLSGGQESKQEVVTTEPVAKQAGLNSEHQQEPEEAENDEETASKSQAQVSTASGKKKKRKKKTKKRGGTHENKEQQEAGTEKQNEKTRTDSVVQDNRLTAEQETSESTAGPQHNQEPEKAKDLEPPENVSTKEKLQEPNTDPGSEGHDQEKHTNTRMSEGADVLGSTQAARLGVEIVNDPQNEEDPEKPDEGSAGEILKESEITGPDQEGNLVTCKSNEDSDSREDIATREATREATGEATDQVSGDEGKTGNTEMLEQSDAVGSSGHIGATAELPEDQQNQETSPTAKETAEPPEGLEESGPEAKMAEGGARETNLPSNKGAEGPNQHLPPCDDSAATPGVQEPDSDHVSGDQEEESPETPDEELVEVLQDQEETSEPEKHESVLQTTEASQTETIKVLINVSETAEDVEETESETGSDGGSNLLTSGKSEDPEEAIPPHRSSPEDVSVVQNVLTKSGSMERDEKMINNPESLVDGVPESRTGPEINEETSASSANDEAGDQPETWPTSKEAAEPKVRTSEELCRDDDGAEPEGPPLHLEGEVESADPTQAETGDTGSPPKASAGRPEPEDGPNTGEVKELMEEPEGLDSPPHFQLDDGEEDEGQSFDFDDSDVEAAVESALSSKLDLEDVEKGAEVNGDSSQRCQSNAETKTDDGEETVSQDDDGDVDQPSTANDLPSGDDTPEQVENVPENTEQKTSPTAEDGLDATQVPSGPHKTPEQTHGAKEEPQGRDPKKKKGKGKSKEDCKMS